MTAVRWTGQGEEVSLQMQGHACAGEKNGDPVCAALSILAYTAEALLRQMGAEGKLRAAPVIRMEPGNVALFGRVKGEHRQELQCRWQVLRTGLELLQASEPAHVKLIVESGR